MRRFYIFLVGISLLSTSLFFSAPLDRAFAMSSSGSNSTCGSSYPAPYTGGADIAKFFHLSDGSTVTITVIGAVVKQGRCATPYREGWINVSDICGISSAQDLNGRLASGSSNPFGSATFSGCNTAQSPANPQNPTTVNIINTNTQTQSQAQGGTGPQTAASATAKTSSATASAQAQVQGAQTAAVSAVKTLPNTGPGNILMLSGTTTALGTLGHLFYSRRRR
jgi:hypothetical protein